MPQPSKSRTMTATCARFAASATREKSLRRASVEGALIWTGGGGPATATSVGDCCVDETTDEVFLECMGDETGASIVRGMWVPVRLELASLFVREGVARVGEAARQAGRSVDGIGRRCYAEEEESSKPTTAGEMDMRRPEQGR